MVLRWSMRRMVHLWSPYPQVMPLTTASALETTATNSSSSSNTAAATQWKTVLSWGHQARGSSWPSNHWAWEGLDHYHRLVSQSWDSFTLNWHPNCAFPGGIFGLGQEVEGVGEERQQPEWQEQDQPEQGLWILPQRASFTICQWEQQQSGMWIGKPYN